ncbi:hypothetical protein BT69DRAFT_1292571 [Atractiella rhizophila]|nr:hypothetical protein BT69DRAFT_1292571 [Atractiella rhizophila]
MTRRTKRTTKRQIPVDSANPIEEEEDFEEPVRKVTETYAPSPQTPQRPINYRGRPSSESPSPGLQSTAKTEFINLVDGITYRLFKDIDFGSEDSRKAFASGLQKFQEKYGTPVEEQYLNQIKGRLHWLNRAKDGIVAFAEGHMDEPDANLCLHACCFPSTSDSAEDMTTKELAGKNDKENSINAAGIETLQSLKRRPERGEREQSSANRERFSARDEEEEEVQSDEDVPMNSKRGEKRPNVVMSDDDKVEDERSSKRTKGMSDLQTQAYTSRGSGQSHYQQSNPPSAMKNEDLRRVGEPQATSMSLDWNYKEVAEMVVFKQARYRNLTMDEVGFVLDDDSNPPLRLQLECYVKEKRRDLQHYVFGNATNLAKVYLETEHEYEYSEKVTEAKEILLSSVKAIKDTLMDYQPNDLIQMIYVHVLMEGANVDDLYNLPEYSGAVVCLYRSALQIIAVETYFWHDKKQKKGGWAKRDLRKWFKSLMTGLMTLNLSATQWRVDNGCNEEVVVSQLFLFMLLHAVNVMWLWGYRRFPRADKTVNTGVVVAAFDGNGRWQGWKG